jgi:hypothetical protein
MGMPLGWRPVMENFSPSPGCMLSDLNIFPVSPCRSKGGTSHVQLIVQVMEAANLLVTINAGKNLINSHGSTVRVFSW